MSFRSRFGNLTVAQVLEMNETARLWQVHKLLKEIQGEEF